ncbi:MAG: hypothetical protein EOM66_03495 [Clostridia bacterium]|nr:hypothetical protein [Candidatus Pelethousia sp.]NCB30453.1 hypothetical protein [Clostridia bacterium]
MRKLNILILALCLLASGCQLARPEAEAPAEPIGLWMELHKEGDALPEGYVPAIDLGAEGTLGLILYSEEPGEDGEPVTVMGKEVSPQFMDRNFALHVNTDDRNTKTTSASFTGTLYLDRNVGAAPQEIWMWDIFRAVDGSLYAGPERCHISYPRQYELKDGESVTETISSKTTDNAGKAGESSYSIILKGIGRLEKVTILEFDQDFNRLSGVSLEIQEEDAYQTRPDTAYVTIEETYVANGKTNVECTTYSQDDAIDYDGDMALYHACKYMGPGGIALPRGLKIIF